MRSRRKRHDLLSHKFFVEDQCMWKNKPYDVIVNVFIRFQLGRQQQLRKNAMACPEKSHTSGACIDTNTTFPPWFVHMYREAALLFNTAEEENKVHEYFWMLVQ